MKNVFLLTVALITIMLSISLLPPPLTSDARGVTSVTISTIRNSCIVNNANIAVQNLNITPLDAINNWWGMPTGATHDNIPSGDAVGQNVIHAPHLPTMPFLCDLTSADWIPFSEQDLQRAINSHIPYLGGIAFALIDLEWGRGAKFDILTHPNYGNLHGVAYISIKPNPTGDLITLQLDLTRLPVDETVRQIVTCELVPLFVNSLQQVQNRYVSPSQHIASMVVMDSDLMMRFSPPTEITPEPTPEFVLNYDASCLPNLTPPSETTPEPGDGESLNLVTIPPLEGEFELSTITPVENNVTTQSFSLTVSAPDPCDPGEMGWCFLLSEVGDIFTYVNTDNQFISVNRVDAGIIQVTHAAAIGNIFPLLYPSWGRVGQNHYRLGFVCSPGGGGGCYWDSQSDSYNLVTELYGGVYSASISPNGNQMMVGPLWFDISISPSIISNIPNASFPQWSGTSLYYLLNSGTPSFITRIRKHPDTTFFASAGNRFSVYDNNGLTEILHVNGNANPYTVQYYNSTFGTNPLQTVVTFDKFSRVLWSPRGEHFVAIYPQSPSNRMYQLYHYDSITNVANPVLIATDDFNFNNGVTWASGIDLSSFIPPPTTGDCPDPSSLPSGSVDYYIAELCQYGITAFSNGLPTVPITIDGAGEMDWHTTQYIYHNPWQASHLEDILAGVEKTALAFDMLANEINPTNTEDAKALFRRIMGNFYVLNVDNGFQIYPSDGCNGTTSSSCTSNTIGAVTFYSMTPNQYTMVHEIGHRFNFKTDNNNGRSPQSLYGYMETATVLDNNSGFLFGTSTLELAESDPRRPSAENFRLCSDKKEYTDRRICAISQWRRGERGWGSGPSSQYDDYGRALCIRITNFQQDSYRVEEWAFARGSFERQTEIDEAAADMFLNWIYYKTTNGEEGFENKSWLGSTCQTTVESNDTSNPGTVRFNWMENSMNCIFTNHQDSECKQ